MLQGSWLCLPSQTRNILGNTIEESNAVAFFLRLPYIQECEMHRRKVLGSVRKKLVAHMSDRAGFSTTQGICNRMQSSMIRTQKAYRRFACFTCNRDVPRMPRIPSGSRRDLNGRGHGAPLLRSSGGTGMARAREDVPQGGARNTASARQTSSATRRSWSCRVKSKRTAGPLRRLVLRK